MCACGGVRENSLCFAIEFQGNPRNRHLKFRKHFEQKRFELFITAIYLVNQQSRCALVFCDGLQQWSFEQKRLAENSRFFLSF